VRDWCDGQQGVPTPIPRNGPGGGGQHGAVKAEGAARADTRGQAPLHCAKARRAGEDDHNGAAHRLTKADQRRRV